jgi:tetratricopeptide (TPR) repeat protein/peroxiredoxin
MPRNQRSQCDFSRRDFLKTISWTPALFLPPGLRAAPVWSGQKSGFSFTADLRLAPHYPVKSPLDELFRQVAPGSDEFVTESYADEIVNIFARWSTQLQSGSRSEEGLAKYLAASIEFNSLAPAQAVPMRSDGPIRTSRRLFSPALTRSAGERFLREMENYLAQIGRIETAEFLVVGIEAPTGSPLAAEIRYDLVGEPADAIREQRVGHWRTHWSRENSEWRLIRWEALGETVAQVRGPVFLDVTPQALGDNESYRKQLLRGADYWRTVIDGACGIDVYGNNGIAAGDFDNDGFDDLYVCQGPGLPNRLYHSRGDGSFEDVTESAGVGVLDGTACALFVDFQNRGVQDLLVVCVNGPMLFLNEGNGKFTRKPDAFQFAQPPQGTFTHAAIADYDGDGRLDIYCCLYSYYLGLDQYHYPVPYFDARNGPPNFLLHNEGDASFVDRTEAAGLNAENDRFSFACAWGDSNGDGHPDLYVANDFGRDNLYRNNGDGTFTAISAEARIQDGGAGMSACWLDIDNDGRQDIYVSKMWSPAGLRVTQQAAFHEGDPEEIRALYRQHAAGNSLFQNQGNGRFNNDSERAGVFMGRWAWSSDSWDLDHDGFPDLYVANGYISGADSRDLSSFFWRHVVGKSPSTPTPSPTYEHGWNAINELIRSDMSWSGCERNLCYINNRDGSFCEASGALALDFPDDSRSFAFADLDHDGRVEIILKNRNAPQLRILRNAMQDIGESISFGLRGKKSNRDAIGSAITVEAGELRQTKYLQAGSGFLSQHSKEVFFGLGKPKASPRATIRWPSGLKQTFEHLPVNHRIEIIEGSSDFRVVPFGVSAAAYARASQAPASEPLPGSVETWLIEPLRAPHFTLPDMSGNTCSLRSFQGNPLLLCFVSADSPASRDQLQLLRKHQSDLSASGLRVAGVSVENGSESGAVQPYVAQKGFSFPMLLATAEVSGIYNIVYRYLYDRRRDLSIPTSFLIDENGNIVKLYQGIVSPDQLVADVTSIPETSGQRARKALPFVGFGPMSDFQRNDFTYGVAMFQHGYLDAAEESFKEVIATKPKYAEAYYNLGTLYLRRNSLADARRYLQQALELRPEYPEALNNLGMIAAQENQTSEAIRNFQQSLQQRPNYSIALLNLGNLYRRQGNDAGAQTLLNRALQIEPDDPEVNYSMGMLYARQDQVQNALQYLAKAVSLRPDYVDALNNLGVLYIRERRYVEAEERFKTCIRVAPSFDQAYLNLARLYVLLNDDVKAKATLQALLRLQPQHKMAQQALEMLH